MRTICSHPPAHPDGEKERACSGMLQSNQEARVAMDPTQHTAQSMAHASTLRPRDRGRKG